MDNTSFGSRRGGLTDLIERELGKVFEPHRRHPYPKAAATVVPVPFERRPLSQREQRVGEPVDARNARERIVDRRRQRTDSDLHDLRASELGILCKRTVTPDVVSVSECNLRKMPTPQIVTVIASHEDCRGPDSTPKHSREARQGIPCRGPLYVSRQARVRLLLSCHANEQREESGILQRRERYPGPGQILRLSPSRSGSEHLDSPPEVFARHP